MPTYLFRFHSNATFSRCSGDSSPGAYEACANEIGLSLLLLLLFIVYGLKIWSFRPYKTLDDFKRLLTLDNLMELVVRVLASTCLAIQHLGQPFKFCAAFGIFFAFLGNLFCFIFHTPTFYLNELTLKLLLKLFHVKGQKMNHW